MRPVTVVMVLALFILGPEVQEAQVDEDNSSGAAESVAGSYERFATEPFFESVPARSTFGLRHNELDAAFDVWAPGAASAVGAGAGARKDGAAAAAGLDRSYIFGSWSNLEQLSLTDSVTGTPLQFGLHVANPGDTASAARRGTSVAARVAADALGTAPADGPRPESVATPPEVLQDDQGREYLFYPETRMLEFTRAAVFQWSAEAMLVAPMFGTNVGYRLGVAQERGDPDDPDTWIRDNFTRTTREYRNEPTDDGTPVPVLEQTFTETSTRAHSSTAIDLSVPFVAGADRASRIEPRIGYRLLDRSRAFEQEASFAGDLDEPRSPANAVDARTDIVHRWNAGGNYELRLPTGWRISTDVATYGWIAPDATAEDTAQQLLYDPNAGGERLGPRDETRVEEERRGRTGFLGDVGLAYRFSFDALGRLFRLDSEPALSVYHRREPTVRYDLVERRTRRLEGTPDGDGDLPEELRTSATERVESFTRVGPTESLSGIRLTSGARIALPVAIEARPFGGAVAFTIGGNVAAEVAGVGEYGQTYSVTETTTDLLAGEAGDEVERREEIPSFSRDSDFDLDVDVRAGIRTVLAGGELALVIESGNLLQSIDNMTGQVIFALPIGR
ncbi:MAG: hypothetical protein ACOCYC_01990 [bacterium]